MWDRPTKDAKTVIIIIIFIYTRRCQRQRRVVLYRPDMWLIYLRTNTAHHTLQRPVISNFVESSRLLLTWRFMPRDRVPQCVFLSLNNINRFTINTLNVSSTDSSEN